MPTKPRTIKPVPLTAPAYAFERPADQARKCIACGKRAGGAWVHVTDAGPLHTARNRRLAASKVPNGHWEREYQYWKEVYQAWARTQGELSKEERAIKAQAYRKMEEARSHSRKIVNPSRKMPDAVKRMLAARKRKNPSGRRQRARGVRAHPGRYEVVLYDGDREVKRTPITHKGHLANVGNRVYAMVMPWLKGHPERAMEMYTAGSDQADWWLIYDPRSGEHVFS